MTYGSVPFNNQRWGVFRSPNGLDPTTAHRSTAHMGNAGYDARLAHGFGGHGYTTDATVWSPHQQAGLPLFAQRYGVDEDGNGREVTGTGDRLDDANPIAMEGPSERSVAVWNAVVALANHLHELHYGGGVRATVHEKLSDLAALRVRVGDEINDITKDEKAQMMFRYLAGKVTGKGHHTSMTDFFH